MKCASALKSPDAERLIQDVDGTIYPLNQLLIVLPTSAPRSLAIDVANSLGAEIVGYSGAANVYQLELSTADKGALNAVIESLAADSRLRGAAKNFMFTLFSIATDLANLGFCHPGFTDSYMQVKLLDAWNLTGASGAFLNIGIIDSGIDRTHPEFSHVSVRPADSLVSPNDTAGHGTAVSGIIGAGNDLTFSSCTPPFDVQMNGFISGVQVSYFLNVVGSSTVGAIFAINFPVLVDILAREGAQVINVSMGITKQEDLPFLPLNKAVFDVITSTFRSTVQAYPDVLFTFSAGESVSGFDAGNVTPANLGGPTGEPNVLTVAATDLADKRAVGQSWGSSNFGSDVDIAAPGVHVYAPTLFTAPLDRGDYVFFSGTSASAPMVTGAAAILTALGAGGPANLKYYLVNSGDPIVTDKLIGGRRLNVFCAVQLVLPPPPGLVMDDDFSEGYRDCSRWFTTVAPPGIGTIVVNQELDMTQAISGDGYMGLASRCKVSGDFDVQVDYKLLSWPAQNFHTVRLMASDLPDGGTGFPGIYRNSYADENYQFRNQLGLAGLVSIPTSDMSGTMRLKRIGQTLYGYNSHGVIGSAPTTSNPTGFTIDFAGPSPTLPAIAFDNFKVNTGIVDCTP